MAAAARAGRRAARRSRARPPTFSPLAELVGIIIVSGLYGGIPYLVLAVYATWWIDHRPEPVVRRRALQAPLWMIGLWIMAAAVVGVRSGKLDMFAVLVGLGAAAILVVGYAYVGLVFLLRALLSRFLDVADALDA